MQNITAARFTSIPAKCYLPLLDIIYMTQHSIVRKSRAQGLEKETKCVDLFVISYFDVHNSPTMPNVDRSTRKNRPVVSAAIFCDLPKAKRTLRCSATGRRYH